MKLDHAIIEETKLAVTEVLKHSMELSDSFVDFIVQNKPEFFKQQEPGTEGTPVMNPFVIVELLNKQLEAKFNEFRKNPENLKGMKPREEKPGSVVNFSSKNKPKLDS